MSTSAGRASASAAAASATVLLCAAAAVATAAGGFVVLKRSRQQRQRRRTAQDDDGGGGGGGSRNGAAAADAATSEKAGAGRGGGAAANAASPRGVVDVSAGDDGEESFGRNLRGDLRRVQSRGTVTVAYASTTDTCRVMAEALRDGLELRLGGGGKGGVVEVQICRVDELDWWDEVLNPEADDDDDDDVADEDGEDEDAAEKTKTEKEKKKTTTTVACEDPDEGSSGPDPIALFVLPTWTNGELPPSSQPLLTSLEEISTDWRVAPNPLRPSGLAVGAFGVGSSAYDVETFCRPTRQVVELMVGKLGARGLCAVGTGDVEVGGDCEESFKVWMGKVLDAVERKCGCGGGGRRGGPIQGEQTPGGSDGLSGCCGGHTEEADDACACKQQTSEVGAGGNNSKNSPGTGAVHEVRGGNDDESYDDSDSDDGEEPEIMDLEDIGDAMKSSSSQQQRTSGGPPKEMVTPKQAAALKKEGYKLIGTHSAVKLCRWTKHQLRGRGGCYKHTFYGITSYQCMEATPSLACANKCVFCWRHHKNPVGREWRWKTDDPNFIVDEAVRTHVKMIKETRGIPGVRMDRWTEAHTVRHCALSLVGEPIMYPRIDELLADLHGRNISTFLVTNGQHPQAIRDLRPITQLYVSVDAPTPESLEAIDRPLFNDAWDRLRQSLRCLRSKGQRTVARLTVVKGWNSDEVEGYARLIALGRCSLVEVKGVTFCGKSDASNLNMSNTPWHHEVVALTTKLMHELNKMHRAGGDDAPPEYGLACEHRHSVSVLLARVDQFAVPADPAAPAGAPRKWRTWIDYDKFQELANRAASDPNFSFGVRDYTAETPSWALFGADEEGFDPTDTRHRKKRKHPKYTKFDGEGVPTHDRNGDVIGEEEREELRQRMEEKKEEIGSASSVTELKGGEISVEDASLMYRGLTVTK